MAKLPALTQTRRCLVICSGSYNSIDPTGSVAKIAGEANAIAGRLVEAASADEKAIRLGLSQSKASLPLHDVRLR